MPKYICKFACQFRGVLVLPDTVLDITDEEAKANAGQVASSFSKLSPGGFAADGEDKPDSYGMTKDDYRRKLDAFGAAYDPTDDIDTLRKKFERSVSTQSRKRVN